MVQSNLLMFVLHVVCSSLFPPISHTTKYPCNGVYIIIQNAAGSQSQLTKAQASGFVSARRRGSRGSRLVPMDLFVLALTRICASRIKRTLRARAIRSDLRTAAARAARTGPSAKMSPDWLARVEDGQYSGIC